MADEIVPRLRAPGRPTATCASSTTPAGCGTCSATTSSTATWTAPVTCCTMDLLRLLGQGGFRRLDTKVAQFFADPRTRRIFSFQSMYAGRRAAPGARAVRGHRLPGHRSPASTSRAAASTPCRWRWPRAAEKHGVTFRYGTTVTGVEVAGGRARAVHTADGERIPADVVVLNPDLPVAYRDLLPRDAAADRAGCASRRPRWSLHIGSKQRYEQDRAPQHPLRLGPGAARSTRSSGAAT